MLLCCVAIAIAYDTFFFDGPKVIEQKEIIDLKKLNIFSRFIIKVSSSSPFLYSSFAILLAIFLGTLGASLRQLLSKYKDKILIKKN